MNVVKKLISYPKVDPNQGVTKVGATQLIIAADNERANVIKDLLLHHGLPECRVSSLDSHRSKPHGWTG